MTGTYMIISGGGLGQPRYSTDRCAEFELVANRFDATQGRSMGLQSNADHSLLARTNDAGGLSGYFRDEGLNAEDSSLPASVAVFESAASRDVWRIDPQKDRVHFFANLEWET